MARSLHVLFVILCLGGLPARVAAVDVTVVVASDTHFVTTTPTANVQRCISGMNAISGVAYPSGIGGTVASPQAAILCGDLCTGGETLTGAANDDKYRTQWSGFDYYFPKLGDPGAGRVHYPTYAAPGNHDYYRWLGTAFPWNTTSNVVAQAVMARYGSGTGGIQNGNVCYSFDLGGVHFVCVGRWGDDQVLAWLSTDLASVPKGTPVVPFLHYAVDDDGTWYTASEIAALAAKLTGSRVVCVLHGHTHTSRAYAWNGSTVFDDGTADNPNTSSPGEFGVLHITDSVVTYAQRVAQSAGDYWKWSVAYCTITGYARNCASPVSGATLSASNSGGTATTGSDGYYSLSVPVGWSGTVTPSKSGVTFATLPRSYSNIQSSVAGQDYSTDSTPPLPGTAVAPPYANAPFAVTYSGASDSCSLAKVELWYRKGDNGTWMNSGQLQPGTSGSFTFTAAGDDTYYFDLVAEDLAGNRSAAVSGAGDGSTVYDSIPPTTTSAPGGGVYASQQNVVLAADEPATIYYTTDGTEPTTLSTVYVSALSVSSDTTLRFFGKDAAGNTEQAKTSAYTILSQPGSIADAKLLGNGEPVELANKDLYLKWVGDGDTFGYIEEPERFAGVRLQGAVTASQGDRVCLVGTMIKPPSAEPYIQVSEMTSDGLASVTPLVANHRTVCLSLMDGIFVVTWGRVKPDSITSNSYVITDGSDDAGIRVVTRTAPTVNAGDFVLVTGAAGIDDGRVLYE
jgi:hypothetical protein